VSAWPHLIAIAAAAAWRIAFVTASAPVIGAVLLLAIARVTGARWDPLDRLAASAVWFLPAGALLGLSQLAVVAPGHLVVWMSWWAVSLRGLIVITALAFASWRLRQRASTTFAAVVLALYATVVTPWASDTMLGHAPGHPVSAIGMMQLTQSVAGATAVALAGRMGSVVFQRDMGKLMIAAALGLAYLAYMDYLIVWYGNLPSRVGFYADRSSWAMALLVWAGLVTGLTVPILLLWQVRADWGQRLAGLSVLAGLLLFNLWWIGGGWLAGLGGIALTGVVAALGWRLVCAGDSHA
jgi:hypothetical protein